MLPTMKIQKTLLSAVLILAIFLGCAGTAHAAQETTAEDCIRRMVSYYYHYQDLAATDIARVGEELAAIDPWQAETWLCLLTQWAAINRDLPLDSDTLPPGLPDDDSLCIVVLGYQLASDGSMQPELLGRLEVARKAAEQYPNAYVLVTGGGTAARNPSATEAGEMARWLTRHGIDKSRIIIEDRSRSTTQNAVYSCRILQDDYSQIRSLAMVTSDYHIRRGSVCFSAESVLHGEVPLAIVAAASYRTGRRSETVSSQLSEISRISGIDLGDPDKPALSRLTGLTVSGQTAYTEGDTLAINVTAHYDSDFSRDVTALADFTPVDMWQPGAQTLTVTYREGGREAAQSVTVSVTLQDSAQSDLQKLLAFIGHDPEKAESLALTTARFAPIILFVLIVPVLAGLGFSLRAVLRRIRPKKRQKRENPLRK